MPANEPTQDEIIDHILRSTPERSWVQYEESFSKWYVGNQGRLAKGRVSQKCFTSMKSAGLIHVSGGDINQNVFGYGQGVFIMLTDKAVGIRNGVGWLAMVREMQIRNRKEPTSRRVAKKNRTHNDLKNDILSYLMYDSSRHWECASTISILMNADFDLVYVLVEELKDSGYVDLTETPGRGKYTDDYIVIIKPPGRAYIKHDAYREKSSHSAIKKWSSMALVWASNFNTWWDAVTRVFWVLLFIAVIIFGRKLVLEVVRKYSPEVEQETIENSIKTQ